MTERKFEQRIVELFGARCPEQDASDCMVCHAWELHEQGEYGALLALFIEAEEYQAKPLCVSDGGSAILLNE
jgi:hypothetical protein